MAIGTAQSPDQIYWHVDYIDAFATARFSTYGRGIWDFVLAGAILFRSGFEN
ncbi:MAG: hypothetical protein IT479_14010 [Xanthomonadales bacterium]|nr:hypothetical protein [Xanthomonadales bacterium]